MLKIRVVVEVVGGSVISVRSDTPNVEVRVADYDALDGGTHVIDDDITFSAMDFDAELDVDAVDNFFNSKEI